MALVAAQLLAHTPGDTRLGTSCCSVLTGGTCPCSTRPMLSRFPDPLPGGSSGACEMRSMQSTAEGRSGHC